jgi:hypothetical protein
MFKNGTVLVSSSSSSRHFSPAKIRYSLITALHCTSFLPPILYAVAPPFVDNLKILDSYWATSCDSADWRRLIGRLIVKIVKESHPSIWLGKSKSRLHFKNLLLLKTTNIYFSSLKEALR